MPSALHCVPESLLWPLAATRRSQPRPSTQPSRPRPYSQSSSAACPRPLSAGSTSTASFLASPASLAPCRSLEQLRRRTRFATFGAAALDLAAKLPPNRREAHAHPAATNHPAEPAVSASVWSRYSFALRTRSTTCPCEQNNLYSARPDEADRTATATRTSSSATWNRRRTPSTSTAAPIWRDVHTGGSYASGSSRRWSRRKGNRSARGR